MNHLESCILRELPAVLETPRLIVRAYQNGDGADLHAAIQRSLDHLSPWMPWVNPKQTLDAAEVYGRTMQAHWMLRTDFVFQIRRKSDQAFLGALGLHEPDWTTQSFTMGWWTTADGAGQGHATEAAQAVLDFGFAHLNAKRIWAGCDVDNAASERVMQKIGMALEGRFVNDGLKPDGRVRSSLRYAKVAKVAE